MHLTTENLKASYADKEILKGICLEVKKHHFVGIIGPNGCGKSTLLKCIYRVLKPQSGVVKLEGESIHEMSHRESAKRMAVVAQHNHTEFDFSVAEVVLMGRTPHKKTLERDNAKDYEIVEQALTQVGMQAYKNRRLGSLSGGEKQRVILARALTQEPKYLILDEPTNHMDIKHQLELLKLVKSMEVTVVSALHDLNIASMFCDYIYVMQSGEIVAHGDPKQVLTEAFIESVYGVKAKLIFDEVLQANHIVYLP